MASITGLDILHYLEGKASTKVLKRMQGWAESKPKRKRKLERYEQIYNEFPHIREYVKTEGSEWDSFLSLMNQVDSQPKVTSKLVEQPDDVQLLHYISGLAGPKLGLKVSEWAGSNIENEKHLTDLGRIHVTSNGLGEYKYTDSGLAFKNFQLYRGKEKFPIQTASLIGLNKEDEDERSGGLLWPLLAAAIVAIIFSLWFFGDRFSNQDKTLITSTLGNQELIELSDGSTINLGEHSTLEYFADVNKQQERTVKLTGTGIFDVKTDHERPFTVISEEVLIIKVEGTKFSVDSDQDFLKVIKNLEGKIKVCVAHDTSFNVVIHPGEAYGYDGKRFIKIEEPLDSNNVEEYNMIDVLDHLMQASNWKVTIAPYQTFQGDDKILINLDQPYESILEDLVSRTDFSYEEMGCEGCYQIVRFSGK